MKKLWVVCGVVLGLIAYGIVSVGAQSANNGSSCADPFNGENVRFNVSYWEKTDFCNTSIAYVVSPLQFV